MLYADARVKRSHQCVVQSASLSHSVSMGRLPEPQLACYINTETCEVFLFPNVVRGVITGSVITWRASVTCSGVR
jgi:hypothetical protein